MNGDSKLRGIRTILLIEDEEALARGMSGLLERHGFTVFSARDGHEAMKIPLEGKVDLVITDIFMEGMDGLETLMHLKREFPTLPIIAVSGGSGKVGVDCLRMAQHLGADRTLRKPVLISVLLDAIRELEPGATTSSPPPNEAGQGGGVDERKP